MGTLEIINFVFSNLFAGLMTMWKNKQEDQRSEREFYLHTIKEQGNQTKSARNYKGVPITEQNRIRTYGRKFFVFGKTFGWETDLNDSGKYKSSTGFHITRRIIALLCVISIIVLPIILPVFADASVTFGYIENSRSFLPWVNEAPVTKWLSVGDATKNIVITPLQTNIMISIIGLFFGNTVAKKG